MTHTRLEGNCVAFCDSDYHLGVKVDSWTALDSPVSIRSVPGKRSPQQLGLNSLSLM